MDIPFFVHHVGRWRFVLFRLPHPEGGLQGFADVHDGYDKLCRVTLTGRFPTQNALGAALNDRCLRWVDDWEAQRLASMGPDWSYPLQPN